MSKRKKYIEAEKRQEVPTDVVFVTPTDAWIKPRTDNQREFIKKIKEKDLVIAIGPAGTGKTFLSVAIALQALKEEKIERIILTRPVVEAGERLGFLPGTLEEKINPYLRPLYDAFWYLLGKEKFQILHDEETIEIAPLAYMRGRTLENAYIILDEAQNTTIEQMMMILTRMGQHSKIIVNGDITQIDLPTNKVSGLEKLPEIIGQNPNIGFQHFTDVDVVRHPIVRELVVAFDAWKQKNGRK